MHVDEEKKFDKRNVERNIKAGFMTQKEYETYLSKLPDVRDKVFNPEEPAGPRTEEETVTKRETKKKKARAKEK